MFFKMNLFKVTLVTNQDADNTSITRSTLVTNQDADHTSITRSKQQNDG